MSVLTHPFIGRRRAKTGRLILIAGVLAFAATVGIGLARCLTAAPGDELWVPLSVDTRQGLKRERSFGADGGVLSGSYWRSMCAFYVQSRTSPSLAGPGPFSQTGRGLPLDIAVWSAAAPFRAESTMEYVAETLDRRLTGAAAVNNPVGFAIEEHGAGWPVAAVTRRRTLAYEFPAGAAAPSYGSLPSVGEKVEWRASGMGIAFGLAVWWIGITIALCVVSFAARQLKRGGTAVTPCPGCGYERSGLPVDAACPECGKAP